MVFAVLIKAASPAAAQELIQKGETLDRQAILVKKQSHEQTRQLARKGDYPYLSGNDSYNWGWNSFPIRMRST
jgi:hypothetical protein